MEFGRRLRFDGLLRLKRPTNIAGQDVSKNLLTFAHDGPALLTIVGVAFGLPAEC